MTPFFSPGPNPYGPPKVMMAAVGDKMTVMLDSGVRRGADILVAFCLGAQFVFFGRPTLYGAIVGGVPGVKKVVVVMEHSAKNEAKLLHKCTLPLTGAGVVDLVITDLGVFAIDRKGGGMTLIELAPDVSLDDIKARTEATYKVANTLTH